MTNHDHPLRSRAIRGPALAMPRQAAPVDRAALPATLARGAGVEADLFGLPVGDWLEAPGAYLWDQAKGWLNA